MTAPASPHLTTPGRHPLLHDFNVEFGTPSPASRSWRRVAVRLSTPPGDRRPRGDPPLGLAVLFFRPSLWRDGFEVYLAELYVVPDRRDGASVGPSWPPP